MKTEYLIGLGLLAVLLSFSQGTPASEIIPPNEPLNTKLPRSMGGDYDQGDENE